MKSNVLVFPCGSEIGLEVYESVRYSTHFNLVGGSSVTDHGSFVYENYIGDIPNIDDDGFIHRINKIISKYNIDYIIPAHDSVVLELAKAKAVGKIDCEIVTSSYETCKIARSKKNTYEVLKDTIKVPSLYEIDDLRSENFPIFMKPNVGQGSKGVYKAYNLEEVIFYKSHDSTLMCMEYLPGAEYTVDCFTDYEGNMKFCSGRVRRRIANGISVNTENVEDERFHNIALKIQSKLKFNGAWFFQLKENTNGELVLMEIAPRIAGTMGHERVYGVNLALLSLYNSAKINVEVIRNKDIKIITDRALKSSYIHDIKFEHVYLDLDDLLIFKGKINTKIISFVYQCHNKDIKVYLLSKHAENIKSTLEKYRISELFDDVIHISRDEEKYAYIAHKDSIFVDDSNLERTKVRARLGIPVFDAHSIDVLIEN